jgi:hypothetical protein
LIALQFNLYLFARNFDRLSQNSNKWREMNCSIYEETRGSLCVEGVLGKCYPRCCHLHWTRQEEDCHSYRCRLCFKETRQNFVRFRRLNLLFTYSHHLKGLFQDHQINRN